MATPSSPVLARLFLSEVRAGLFRIFLGPEPGRLYRAEIIARLDFAAGSVEEELEKLVRLELLHTTKDGNRRYFEVNRSHPLYPELRGIVLKTGGLRDVLAGALAGARVEHAFVFGSIAAGTETAASDVDLMVLGAATHRQTASGLRRAGEALGRVINPHFWDVEDWCARLAKQDHFLGNVMAGPKLFIVGDEHEFALLCEKHPRLAPD